MHDAVGPTGPSPPEMLGTFKKLGLDSHKAAELAFKLHGAMPTHCTTYIFSSKVKSNAQGFLELPVWPVASYHNM